MTFIKLIFIILLALTSCQQYGKVVPGYPVTPDKAADATYFVMKYSVNTGERVNSGTAWIAQTDDKHSYLITAGHVCTWDSKGHFAGHSFMYKLTARDDKEVWASPVAVYDKADLCLLKTNKPLTTPPLLISDKLPGYAAVIGYVGAPDSNYAGGMAPYFSGFYSGGLLVTIPTYPGASGSAVWTTDGVFGVIIKVDLDFHHLVAIVPVTHILEFMKQQGLRD